MTDPILGPFGEFLIKVSHLNKTAPSETRDAKVIKHTTSLAACF